MRTLIALAVLLVISAAGPAPAQTSRAEAVGRALEAELSVEEKKAIQEALVWTGNYDARIDGVFGQGTRTAISEFQQQRGYRPTGYLRQRHADRLFAEREAITSRFGWEIRRFPELGMELGIPTRLFGEPEPMEIGLRYRSRTDARPRSELLLYSAEPMSARRFQRLREEVVDRQRFSRDVYDQAGEGWFVFSGRSGQNIAQYTYVVNAQSGVRGFSFRYDDDERGYDVLNVAMYNSLAPFAARGGQSAASPTPPPRGDRWSPLPPARNEDLVPRGDRGDARAGLGNSDRGRAERPDGQGVIINRSGMVLTSDSAVAECRDIRVNGRFGATVAAIDREVGLAALKLDQREDGYPHLGLRVEPVTEQTDLDVFMTRVADGGPDTDGYPARLHKRGEDPMRLPIRGNRLGRGSAGAALIDIDGRVAGIVVPGRGPRDGARQRDREALNAYAAMAFLAFHGIEFGVEASDQNTRRVVRRATVGIACRD